MKRYKEELDKIQFTELDKLDLINHVKANKNTKIYRKPHLSFAKVAVIIVAISLLTITAYSTGITDSVREIFAPILGTNLTQTEIIDDIGHPVDASATVNGITVSAQAVAGDKNNVYIVYSVKTENGEAFNLPEGISMNNLHFVNSHGITENLYFNSIEFSDILNGYFITDATHFILNQYFEGIGSSSGFTKTQPIDGVDNEFQIIEEVTIDGSLLNRLVKATFTDLGYYDRSTQKSVILFEGTWEFEFRLTYNNTSTVYRIDKDFTLTENPYGITDFSISPLGYRLNYRNNDGLELIDSNSVSITKKDGTVITNFEGGFGSGVSRNGKDVLGDMHGEFGEIIPPNEMESITINGETILLNK